MSIQGTRNSFLKKYVAVAIITLVGAHLSTPVYFPFHPDYTFPTAHFLYSFIDSIIIVHLIDFVYQLFEKKVFKNKVGLRQITYFILTSILIISLYFPLYFFLGLKVLGYPFEAYSLALSLVSTLIVATLFIVIFYGRKFASLLTLTSVRGSLKVKSGKRLHLIPISEIRCFLSQHKNVYLVNHMGERVLTNFSLNELEGLLDKNLFFRANRQYLIQRDAVASITSVANNKLEVVLHESLKLASPISISRYKASEFRIWI